MRILLIEDSIELGKACKKLLLNAQYAVDWVENGELALAALSTEEFDLIILDLALPDMDGLDILKHIRSKQITSAVMILTSRGTIPDKITGLDLGADDYLTKPFDVDELLARVRMLIRRANGKKTSVITFGNLSLNLKKLAATINEESMELTPREFTLLRIFCTKTDVLLSKEQIAQSLTNFDEHISHNAIEQTISRLRKKLVNSNIRIHSARGLGYILEHD